jgi:hypothetical protein
VEWRVEWKLIVAERKRRGGDLGLDGGSYRLASLQERYQLLRRHLNSISGG